jgi:hypothetical protein
LSYLTGLRGVDLGLISGTQTFGHTGLFLLVTVCIAWLLKSKTLAALSLGWVTHLLLDGVTELALASATSQPQFIRALLFPFLGWGFPVMPYSGFQAHLLGGLKAKLLFAEVIGALLLARYLIRSRGRGTILE